MIIVIISVFFIVFSFSLIAPSRNPIHPRYARHATRHTGVSQLAEPHKDVAHNKRFHDNLAARTIPLSMHFQAHNVSLARSNTRTATRGPLKPTITFCAPALMLHSRSSPVATLCHAPVASEISRFPADSDPSSQFASSLPQSALHGYWTLVLYGLMIATR